MYRGIANALVCMTVLLFTACGGNGTTTNNGPASTGATSPFALVSPGQLKAGSAVAGYACTGGDYEPAWPVANYAVDGTVGVFTPDWPGGGSTGLAYACWQFELPYGEERTGEIALDWAAHGDWVDLWIACADHAADCWDWQAGGDIPATYTDDHVSSSNQLYLAICTTGNAEWRLNGAEVATLPDVTAVTPLGLVPGEVATIVPEFTGNVDTWSWNFGTAGTCPDPTIEQPELTACTAPDEYPCSVTVTNRFGSDTFEFTLYNGVLKIFGVDPNGINDSNPFFRITAEYIGIADTWSWDLTSAGNMTVGDSEEAIVTQPYNTGFHECSVTATNSFDSETYEFNLPVCHVETSASDDGTDYGSVDMAVDSQGRPHFSFSCYDPEQICYGYIDGSDWHIETIDTENGKSSYTTIVLDNEDHPHIGYDVTTGNWVCRHAWNDGDGWQIEEFPDADFECPNLTVDDSGVIHAAWFGNVGAGNNTIYGTWDGSAWSYEPVFSSIDETSSFPQLDISPEGTPYVAFKDISTGFRIAGKPGETWEFLPNPPTNSYDYRFNIEAGSDGCVYVMYLNQVDRWNGNQDYEYIVFGFWDRTEWSYADTFGDTPWVNSLSDFTYCWRNQLVLDDQGRLYFCYHQGFWDEFDAVYGWFDGDTRYSYRSGFKGWEGFFPCIDLDGDGYIHLIYHKAAEGKCFIYQTLAP